MYTFMMKELMIVIAALCAISGLTFAVLALSV